MDIQPNPPFRPPHKFIFHWIVASLAIIIVIAYFVTYYYASSPSVTRQPSESAIKIDTTDWKTYTNTSERYSFEFKYPSNFILAGDSDSNGVDSLTIQTRSSTQKDSMTIWVNAENRKPTYQWEEVKKDIVKCDDNSKVIFPIPGGEAMFCYFKFALDSGYFRDYTYDAHSDSDPNRTYTFKTYIAPGDPLLNYKVELLKQIFSTFKFGDSTINSWLNYHNEKYGFDIKYPTDHVIYTGLNQQNETFIPATDKSTKIFIAKNDTQVFCCEPLTLSIEVVDNRTIPLDSWVNKEFINSENSYRVKTKGFEVFAGQRAYRIYSSIGIDSPKNIVAFNYGNETFLIKYDNETMLSKILSTFQLNPALTTYDIKDLGVKFMLPAPLSDLKYHWVHFEHDQALNSVGFSSDRLIKAGCDADKAPMGYLTYNKDRGLIGGDIIGHARGSDLYYIYPNVNCGGELQDDWRILQEALKSLETDYVQ